MSHFNDYGGGGGFLPGGSPYSSTSSPGAGRNREASHSLRPCTVSQLLKATQAHSDAEWTVDDVEIGQVTVVGQVITNQAQTTNVVYWLDDGSGRIEARQWIDSTSEEDSGKYGGIEENMYVRVTGTLKAFGLKRYINTTQIRVTTDPHEVYFHILEAVSVTIMADRGFSSVPPSGASTSKGSTSAYTGQASKITDQYSHLPPLQQKIGPKETRKKSGLGLHSYAYGLNITDEKYSDALDHLMDDGHVFSTIDDSHFNLSI
ncbi:Replication factor A protein 2 [Termitomyces sp. T112]|nr:Replication factor A protein 2 [Termitomyces sp. T112]